MSIINFSIELKERVQKISKLSSFVSLTDSQLETITQDVKLSEELRSWYRTMAPITVHIPWTAGELVLFDVRQLKDMQKGYNWDTKSDHISEDWNEDWLVIASENGNPVIADTGTEKTPIYMDIHGQGRWQPIQVAETLDAYLQFLIAWCKLYNRYGTAQNMLDDDCVILPSVHEELRTLTQNTVGHVLSPNLMSFLWG